MSNIRTLGVVFSVPVCDLFYSLFFLVQTVARSSLIFFPFRSCERSFEVTAFQVIRVIFLNSCTSAPADHFYFSYFDLCAKMLLNVCFLSFLPWMISHLDFWIEAQQTKHQQLVRGRRGRPAPQGRRRRRLPPRRRRYAQEPGFPQHVRLLDRLLVVDVLIKKKYITAVQCCFKQRLQARCWTPLLKWQKKKKISKSCEVAVWAEQSACWWGLKHVILDTELSCQQSFREKEIFSKHLSLWPTVLGFFFCLPESNELASSWKTQLSTVIKFESIAFWKSYDCWKVLDIFIVIRDEKQKKS